MAQKDFKHGYFAGYRQWRYGTPSPASPLAPILSKPQFDLMVDRTATLMRTALSSPFQFEGICRHGLRQQFCVKGYAWARSDAEAARVVEGALEVIGARRPTFEEAQPDYAISPDYCLRCLSPLDDHDITNHRRFCSIECAKATLAHRAFETTYSEDPVGRAAFSLARRADNPPQQCPECSRSFHPRTDGEYDQRYCSKGCAHKAMITIPEYPCEHCGTPFRSKHWMLREEKNHGRFCSAECFHAHRALQTWDCTCEWCGTRFPGKGSQARLCSDACQLASSRYFKKGIVPKRLKLHVFDHFVALPVDRRPPWLLPDRFDELVAA